MNGTHQLLVYADNLLGENIFKKKAFLVLSKVVGLEVNKKRRRNVHVS